MQELIFTQLSILELKEIIQNSVREVLTEKPASDITKSQKSKYLRVQEAADFLSLKKSTVYSLVHKNKIPFRKRGNRLYFNPEELQEWIEISKPVSKSFEEEISQLAKKRLRKR